MEISYAMVILRRGWILTGEIQHATAGSHTEVYGITPLQHIVGTRWRRQLRGTDRMASPSPRVF